MHAASGCHGRLREGECIVEPGGVSALEVTGLHAMRRTEFDTSHVIDKLSFGVEYPGMTNPLDRTRKARANPYNPEGQTGAYQYYLKACTPCAYCQNRRLRMLAAECAEAQHAQRAAAPVHPTARCGACRSSAC